MTADRSENKRLELALLTIAQGAGTSTDQRFFTAMIECLARALNADLAFITRPLPVTATRMRTTLFRRDGAGCDNTAIEPTLPRDHAAPSRPPSGPGPPTRGR